ncbi:protein BRANCHLESS TRICHOME-like [Miscanthus floridulus]|uniref:protein BRANCHLESS TRICHOME-like n=1 Tax=Miscanthus floridulus TaxID=154761 RepID=UPI00345A408E
MIVAPGDDDEEVEELDDQGYGYGAMSSELELCVARIRDLRAELEFERRMRRKAEALSEALAAELADERRRGEAAEAECRALREEAGAARADAERALVGLEEERRMLRVAELWREERVQMKLADARAAVEEKLREIDDAVAQLHATTTAAASDINKSSSPNGSKSTSQHGQQSPSRSQPHRREPGGGGENPHIRRGIKGFVEFPKAVRLRGPREERVDLVSNLECQRAQLRVLMRHRSPAAAGMGLIGAPENLVV